MMDLLVIQIWIMTTSTPNLDHFASELRIICPNLKFLDPSSLRCLKLSVGGTKTVSVIKIIN